MGKFDTFCMIGFALVIYTVTEIATIPGWFCKHRTDAIVMITGGICLIIASILIGGFP